MPLSGRVVALRGNEPAGSDLRWSPGRALRLLEEALGRLGSRRLILPPGLLRASPLTLTGSLLLASPGFCLLSAGLDAVALNTPQGPLMRTVVPGPKHVIAGQDMVEILSGLQAGDDLAEQK